MAPRKKSASSATNSTTGSSEASGSSSSSSGSSSDSSSSDSSASAKDLKTEKNAPQFQQQQRRKSQDASKVKSSERALPSEDHAPSKRPVAKVPITGGKVPPSIIKQMGVVKPSIGMKAAAQQKHKNKITPVKERKKGASSTSDSEDEKKIPAAPIKPQKPLNVPQKRRGRPPKNRQPTKITAASSTSSTSSNTDSDSLTESTDDTGPAKEISSRRDSKKLTRSTNSIKKSKQPVEKDTETDSTRRSLSRSPKRIVKHTKKDIKPTVKIEPLDKRHCPLDGCNSLGHLGGTYDRHFTIEACPMYHNLNASEAKILGNERKRKDEERKKAIEIFDRNKKIVTPEQKVYGQQVRDSRAKFKSPTPSSKETIKPEPDREPNLKNLVPDYDYQLFRQAQSAAAESIENELKTLPASRGTKYITMGKNCMQVWYAAPYPEDVARLPKLYLCEFCLRYQKCAIGMKRHAAKCLWRHPPGDEIYRKGKLGVWQIDGKRQKSFCQNLCLLAKFFLDHKTLYYDVEPFLFYIMTLEDANGCHTIGYFSKEKNSFLNYNVSCILTLPPYQRKGYGRLLIDFSYLLTRVEGKIGSPEKPLSDLGLISYRSYWKDVLLNYLCSRNGNTLSIKDISQEMAINSYDIVSTLQALGMMKYWKGKHIILKKQDVLEEYSERVERKGKLPKIDPSCLRWVPFMAPQPTES